MSRQKTEEQDEVTGISAGTPPVSTIKGLDRSVLLTSVKGEDIARFPKQFGKFKAGDAVETYEYQRLVKEGEAESQDTADDEGIKAAQARTLSTVKGGARSARKAESDEESEDAPRTRRASAKKS